MAEDGRRVNLDEVRRDLVRKIETAPMELSPSPHFIIDDVYDPDLYRGMLKNWPHIELFQKLSDMGRVSYDVERFAILFNKENFARLPENIGKFWGMIWDWVINHPEIQEAFVRRFEAVSGKSWLGAGAYFGDGLLISDRTTYRINPHTDMPHREVTVLYYMPEDESQIKYGTSFYRPKKAGFECPQGLHHDRDLFDEVVRLEFLPNRMMAFIRTNTSFHGVEPIEDEGVDRHLLIYNLRRVKKAA